MDEKTLIARRVALELKDGDLVNLGIGLPTMVANFVPAGVNVYLEAEDGICGMIPLPEKGVGNPDCIDAGGTMVGVMPGGSVFDSATSFGLIRGGHVAATVLGGMEVDELGLLANFMVPGKMVAGMGGAMDLVTGAKTVIVAMTHTAKGKPKILKRCTLPLTSARRINLIVTEMAVIEATDKGLVLKETAPGVTVEQVKAATEANLIVSPNICTMPIAA